MSLAATLRHRRADLHRRETVATNAALLAAARPLRDAAQREIRAGHPELALPYLDEARMFESALRPVSGL